MIRAGAIALCLAVAACAASPPPATDGPPSLASVPPSFYRYRALLPRLPKLQQQPASEASTDAPADKREDEIMRRLDAIEADLKTLRDSTSER